ncbi:TonB-dependent receptor domain-containing protein [Kordia jejudonensis]|uniref:TonB-dependent receptor domain-containing protein n=1 Tax=Kordia jejudonensis TaxID=1348245 RepID=UPI0006293E4B|nr:TonB-dependent receptor [Kordia jejudonensis]
MNKFLILIVLFTSFNCFSQVEIKGKIIDQTTNQPIEFAEVVLTVTASDVSIGTITNAEGAFTLAANSGISYRLQVFYVGKELYSKEITIEKAVDLGDIKVQNSQELTEVIITAQKKLIERKIDRLVFNVENSTKSSEGDALEVLRVTPGVRVQNNNINMIGKGGVQVMVNDKIIQLGGEELANFLKGISSENIKNIEVITTPPAKYDAAGNSGLINIVLRKAKADSWNAQVQSIYLQRHSPTGIFGTSFNFNKNKFSLATSLNYRKEQYYQEQDDYAHFPDGLWYTYSPFKAENEALSGRVDLTYQVNPNWSIGTQYLYNTSNLDVSDAPITPVFDYQTNDIIRSLASEGTTDQNPELHSLNVNSEIKLDTLGRKITMNLDYFTYYNPDEKTYNGTQIIQNPFSEQFFRGINTNEQDLDNWSGSIDVQMPMKWANVEFGGKLTRSMSDNAISFFNSGLVDSPVTNLPIQANDFNYNENIQAVYISANKRLSKRLVVKVGLRYEATQTNSRSINLGLNVDNDYNKLFPTVYFSYQANDKSNFALSYSKRIQRPNFVQLNPNIYFINPFQTIEGNAFLQPSFVDNIEFVHTYKNFITKLYYGQEENSFGQVPLPNSNTNIIRFTNENYIDSWRIGFSENYTFNKIKWWYSNNSFDVNYLKSEFNLPEPQDDQEGLNARIATYNDIRLNENRTLVLGVNYWYDFPGVNGIFDTKSASSLTLAIHWFLMNKKLHLTFRGNDIFKSAAERTTTTVNGVFQRARYYYDNRAFQFSISYRFGNNNIKAKKHQTGNADERGRTGN